MPLSSEQQEKIRSWLVYKNANPKCPMCNKNQWAFGEIITANVVNEKGKVNPDQQAPAMIQIVCTNCGYLRLHLVHKELNLF
jgi:predicted nucleic-acid-binding Zn-ribbon protein